ncbi:MAG: cytochrome c biogenesis protein CcsA [Planctomycetota bacterium]
MATITDSSNALPRERSETITATDVLSAVGSLKLTVGLFAVSLIIVLVGTLAQDELNMQEVKTRYFTSWIAWLRFDDFLPQSFYPHAKPIWGGILFPGGALIGALLTLNLVVAKWSRFRVTATGGRLVAGWLFMLLGAAAIGVIVFLGHSSDGLQGAPPFSYDVLWRVMQFFVVATAVGLTFASTNVNNPPIRAIGLVVAASLGAWMVYTLGTGERIGDSGLRIVWQLTKGLGAGVLMLVGCVLLFGRQGGNLLLHIGVLLLMLAQYSFGDRQLEQQISLVEGDSTNTLINMDEVELAFIVSDDEADHVTAVPGDDLLKAHRTGELIRNEALPVDVRVRDYFANSRVTEKLDEENPATTGWGLQAQAKFARSKGGTESERNAASAYIDLVDKQSGAVLGTHLVSQFLSDRTLFSIDPSDVDLYDEVTVDGTKYNFGLKYHREVKPYWVHLEDVQRRNYSGTETPRDYSSYIRIIDPETGEDRRERVWMNNPLRYRGETFFQSSYFALPSGKEMTGLQVVRNSGWLIPYVACSIMALGMLAHFAGTLKRFVSRRERESAKEFAALSESRQAAIRSPRPALITMVVASGLALYMLVPWDAVNTARKPAERDQSYDLYTAGKIPAQFGGRMMPLDAFARQTLTAISNKESLPLEDAPGTIKQRAVGKKLSAIQWLMEVAIDEPTLQYMPMFRVDAEEVRSQLKLKRRKSKLYSLKELLANWQSADRLITAAKAKDEAALTFKERKLLELDRRTRLYMMTADAFQLPGLPDIPEEELAKLSAEDLQLFQRRVVAQLRSRMAALETMPTARIIPPTQLEAENSVNDPDWVPFASGFFEDASAQATGGPSEGLRSDPFSEMIAAYGDEKKDYERFNQAVDDQIALSAAFPIAGLSSNKISLERWLVSNAPSTRAIILYMISLVLGICFLATGEHRLRQVTWGVLVVAVLVHSVAILSRIYITGKSPIINLYSSAVFIGWAAALFGVIVDRIFRLGFGNLLAATAGTLTLMVASLGLSGGDTMPVLQAVLDTQFWLATHVISVSLGYVATMVAGTLGVGYVLENWFGRSEANSRSLYRMIYGASCFGILFSTIGTILGGLWADDSWGRFWGWDPKENGALLIVIWNALMLHARWDGMVKARGFALLAIGGNIVTAWSWFGTNELGIGLHSYGFQDGTLFWLTVYVVSQIAFVIGGLILWRHANKPDGGVKLSVGKAG